MLQHVGDFVQIVAGVRAQPRLSVDMASDPQIVGIGNLFGAFVSSVGRNPAARDTMFRDVLLGFALTEAVALYALVIALVILFT